LQNIFPYRQEMKEDEKDPFIEQLKLSLDIFAWQKYYGHKEEGQWQKLLEKERKIGL
jgi:hypothetical protein